MTSVSITNLTSAQIDHLGRVFPDPRVPIMLREWVAAQLAEEAARAELARVGMFSVRTTAQQLAHDGHQNAQARLDRATGAILAYPLATNLAGAVDMLLSGESVEGRVCVPCAPTGTRVVAAINGGDVGDDERVTSSDVWAALAGAGQPVTVGDQFEVRHLGGGEWTLHGRKVASSDLRGRINVGGRSFAVFILTPPPAAELG